VLALLQGLSAPWEQAREFVQKNLDHIAAVFNQFERVDNARWASIQPSTVTRLVDTSVVALDAALGPVFRLAANGNRTIAAPANASIDRQIFIQHYAAGGARTLALYTGAGGFRLGSTYSSISATDSARRTTCGVSTMPPTICGMSS